MTLLALLAGCASASGDPGLASTDEFLQRALDVYRVGNPPSPIRNSDTGATGV